MVKLLIPIATSALSLLGVAFFTDTPYSKTTDMSFSSTPAFQEVATGAYFTEAGSCSDKDTYLTDLQAGTEHLVANTSLTIDTTVRSGTVISVNQGLSEAGVATKTLVIKALDVTVDTLKVDDWKFTDTGGPILVNDGYKQSQNSVLIKAPKPQENAGEGN